MRANGIPALGLHERPHLGAWDCGNETWFRYDGGDSFQEYRMVDDVPVIQAAFVRGLGMGGGIGSILCAGRAD